MFVLRSPQAGQGAGLGTRQLNVLRGQLWPPASYRDKLMHIGFTTMDHMTLFVPRLSKLVMPSLLDRLFVLLKESNQVLWQQPWEHGEVRPDLHRRCMAAIFAYSNTREIKTKTKEWNDSIKQ